MSIRVLYFAALAEQVGCRSEELDREAATAGELVDALRSRGEPWSSAFGNRIRSAINQQLAEARSELEQARDEREQQKQDAARTAGELEQARAEIDHPHERCSHGRGSRAGENGHIFVMNDDGTNVVQLTDAASLEDGAQISPDGTRIAFVSKRTGGYRIWVMNADGSGMVPIATNIGRDNEPALLMDGRTDEAREALGQNIVLQPGDVVIVP
mgnify:CR=1 FL=1